MNWIILKKCGTTIALAIAEIQNNLGGGGGGGGGEGVVWGGGEYHMS